MCSTDLNFLETNNEFVVRNFVFIENEEEVTTDFNWFKGNKSKSYGGFVKRISDGQNNGLKAYILPKATPLFFDEKGVENNTSAPE